MIAFSLSLSLSLSPHWLYTLLKESIKTFNENPDLFLTIIIKFCELKVIKLSKSEFIYKMLQNWT